MTPRSRTTQRNPCVNPPVDPTEQDELVGTQGLGGRSDVGSNKAPSPLKALTPSFVSPFAKNLFTKFMKVFMETMQA